LPWRLRGIEEITVDRYAEPKVLWEIILEKETPQSASVYTE